MPIMKSGKEEIKEGIDRQNQEKIWTIRRKENEMYLGILEAEKIKHVAMKEK